MDLLAEFTNCSPDVPKTWWTCYAFSRPSVIDMSPEGITERLIRMSELSDDARPRAHVDMSPEAATQRLEMLAAMATAGEHPRTG